MNRKNKFFVAYMIRKIPFYLFILFVTACTNTSNNGEAPKRNDSLKNHHTFALNIDSIARSVNRPAPEMDDTTDYNYADFYIVVADTGLSYWLLHKKMLQLHRQFNQPIDSLDRYYNVAKDSILLPDNYEDDMYAGAYYPRRSPSTFLSLEYFDFFKSDTREKNIALVTGIYENETSADSAYAILKRVEKNAFKMKAKVYVGCMH